MANRRPSRAGAGLREGAVTSLGAQAFIPPGVWKGPGRGRSLAFFPAQQTPHGGEEYFKVAYYYIYAGVCIRLFSNVGAVIELATFDSYRPMQNVHTVRAINTCASSYT